MRCGERGIRTPGTSRYDGFQDRCNRPLYHLSRRLLCSQPASLSKASAKLRIISLTTKQIDIFFSIYVYKRWKIALLFPNLAGLNAQTCLICSVKVDTGTWCLAFLLRQDNRIEVKITICWGRTNLFHTLHLNFLHQSLVEDIYCIEMIHLVVNIALRFLVLYNKVRIGLNSVRAALSYSFCWHPAYSAVLGTI